MDLRKRPLSPHLQVYKPQLTSMLSIMHRASGVFLALGIVVAALWVIALGYSKQTFDAFHVFFTTFFGKLLFAGFVAAFFYHLCNGIRHLAWDMGRGFEISTLYKTGYSVLVIAAVLTAGYLALMSGLI